MLDDGPELVVEPGELEFGTGDWQVAQPVTVTAQQDDDAAADAPVVLPIAPRGGGYDGAQGSVRATMAEDDAPTLAVAGSRAAERTRRIRFEVTLTVASSAEVTASYATGSPGDSATAGEDYTAESGTVHFAAGSAGVRTIEVSVRDDTTDEPDEQFTVTLSTAVNATLGSGARTATGTITDDDTPGLSIADARAHEDAGQLRFAVTLDHASARMATVGFSTADGTATAGSDYTATSGTLPFTAGARARTIAVLVTDDAGRLRPVRIAADHSSHRAEYPYSAIASKRVGIDKYRYR